jgi:acyl carrier protein
VTEQELRAIVVEELGNNAPEADFGALDPRQDLRKALDIDSMDFLNLVAALDRRLNVAVPETDYPELFTLDKAVKYLAVMVTRKAGS